MAANDMPTAAEFPDLLRINEAWPPYPIRSDEDVTPPAELLKFVGDARVRAYGAIVKRKKYWQVLFPAAELINRANCSALPVNMEKMVTEAAKVKRVTPGSLPECLLRYTTFSNHVVITDRNCSHC